MLRILVLPLLLLSCATKEKTPKGFNNAAVVNLAKTSFIRGCIAGTQKSHAKKTYGDNLEYCKNKSKKHTKDIIEILEQEDIEEGALRISKPQ